MLEVLPSTFVQNLHGSDAPNRIAPEGYSWETDAQGLGSWSQAGYIRVPRAKSLQTIEPNDAKWLDIIAYRRQMRIAMHSIKAVELSSSEDIWNAARRDGTGGLMDIGESFDEADCDMI